MQLGCVGAVSIGRSLFELIVNDIDFDPLCSQTTMLIILLQGEAPNQRLSDSQRGIFPDAF
jgi:hypothetical protein